MGSLLMSTGREPAESRGTQYPGDMPFIGMILLGRKMHSEAHLLPLGVAPRQYVRVFTMRCRTAMRPAEVRAWWPACKAS